MGELFRSEEMTLCQLFLQAEAAYACVAELGELGLVQFRDLQPETNAFQRKFVSEIRRCDEMERKLRFLEKEIKKDDVSVLDVGHNPEAPNPREMVDLEASLEKLENELRDVNTNEESLKRNFLELTELKHILRKTQTFFEEGWELPRAQLAAAAAAAGGTAPHGRGNEEEESLLLGESGLQQQQLWQQQLQFIAGVIHRERLPAFERMLWRVCRGNVFVKQADIDAPLEDPHTGDEVLKSVFIVFFQGEQLKARVKKICEGFRATLYPCPDSQAERREMAISVMTRIEDLNTVLNTTIDHRRRVLISVAKSLQFWFVQVGKIKAIYHTLNMFNFEATSKCLIAEAWCPVKDLDKIHLALRRGTERSGSTVLPILNRMPTREMPPTYFRVNKLTSGFQNIIDAYGVATYREANPTPFAVITFPFLFAVMYGDFGHGLLMFLAALWMVVKERRLAPTTRSSEIWATFFNGRYIILLMGLFSIYTGFIYNDIFSRSVNVFGSGWSVIGQFNSSNPDEAFSRIRGLDTVQLNPNSSQATAWRGQPYPFGLDPIWQVSANKITFTNTIKMKASIVLGVVHMLFGVTVGLCNHLHRRDFLSIVGEFVPQVLFLLAMFGYLIILIVYKWLAYSGENSNCAPNLLIGLINMFLMKYGEPLPNCTDIYSGYQAVQTFLVIVIVLCVPWMLLTKPLVLKRRYAAHNRRHQRLDNGSGGALTADVTASHVGSDSGADQHGHEEHDIGELFVHQTIHTIEYCLGCISNTASYLRLWALSLAHAQLSEVLWTMVLAIGLKQQGYIGAVMLFITFMFWALFTIAVLLLMEGLSAFLHALRLHWVEFMNKFYQGEGHKFDPFDFSAHLSQDAHN